MSEKQLIILIGSLLLIAGSELSVFLDNGKTSLEVMESLLEENGVASDKIAYFLAVVTMTVVLAVLAFLMSFVLYEVFEIFISLKSLLAPGAFQFSSGFSSGELRVSMLYITCMTNIGTRCK